MQLTLMTASLSMTCRQLAGEGKKSRLWTRRTRGKRQLKNISQTQSHPYVLLLMVWYNLCTDEISFQCILPIPRLFECRPQDRYLPVKRFPTGASDCHPSLHTGLKIEHLSNIVTEFFMEFLVVIHAEVVQLAVLCLSQGNSPS